MAPQLSPPDLAPYRVGNTGIAGLWTFDSGRLGPHVAIVALLHGNELSGAWALVHLLEEGVRPRRGRLSLCFANLAAFDRFDPRDPAASRFVEEDLNRVWDDALLDASATSVERTRARELRPFIHSVDLLLDLHSMQAPGEPLLLCGARERGRRLAARMGYPAIVVADRGHEAGTRLIDYGRFAAPRGRAIALLLEAGEHGARRSIDVAIAASLHFLDACGTLEREIAGRLPGRRGRQRFVEVTQTVTVEQGPFRFVREPRSISVVPRAGTTIGFDADREVRTPYDSCVLVLPSRLSPRGLTAVRLGRFVAPPS